MNKKISVTIDFDKGNELFNDANPDKREISRRDIYKNEKITKQTIQNWKNGRVPNGIISLMNYLDRTGLKLSSIMNVTKTDKGKERNIEF